MKSPFVTRRLQQSWLLALLVVSLTCTGSGLVSPHPSPMPTISRLQDEGTPTTPSRLASPALPGSFTWPDWARTARIAGAYFDPTDSDADIDTRLDALAAQHVSVVVADSPWGQSYSAWVDDSEFVAVKAVIAKMVQKAHARGLKVVMYQAGLELVSDPDRNPGTEHPDWPQLSLDGQPVLFNDIDSSQEHWLNNGEWDMWISPCTHFRELAIARARDMVATGMDGLWVDQSYLPSDVGNHEGLWPSTDSCSAAAFQAATGLSVPSAEDWDNPVWRHWVVWRHAQMTDWLVALKEATRAINPQLVFLEENASADTSRATQNANDPAEYLAYADMSTGHEVETIGDRMDEGETGMKDATLDQWLSFRSMVAFARAADRGKPSWILTYGYQPRDSSQLAGMVLSEGGNFYETKGPAMADTAGEAYRTQLFGWIADHAAAVYGGESIAQVGLVYSPRTRDLVDSGSGSPYAVEDAVHFAAYRTTANLLYRAHIPFDLVLDTDINSFNRYTVLILPEVQAMSDATASALRQFSGRILTVGDTGQYDEWLNERTQNALAGVPQEYFAQVSDALIAAANTGLITTTVAMSVQLGLCRTPGGYSIVFVNTASAPTAAFGLDLSLNDIWRSTSAHWSTPDGKEQDVPLSFVSGGAVHVDVPAGIDTLALLTIATTNMRIYLPLVLR
jgi:hypothetical protein